MATAPQQIHGNLGKQIKDTGRALGGALIFSLPILMTQEMWYAGFRLAPEKLLLLFLLGIPLLAKLSHHVGFERTVSWRDDFLDAMFACGIAAITSAVVLIAFGLITLEMSAGEIAGKIAVQTVPAAIGALLARTQLGAETDSEKIKRDETYGGELFLMAVGALFLGFNVAPTEEVVLISFRMTMWHGIVLVVLSVAVMHAFVFAVGFQGGTELSPDTPWWSALLRFTLPGYVLSLLISLYVLWTFGRTDEASFQHIIMMMIVLGFPSSAGAASARLIL